MGKLKILIFILATVLSSTLLFRCGKGKSTSNESVESISGSVNSSKF